MALNIDPSITNSMLQELADAIDAGDPTPGKFQIYSGTKPATPGADITDQVLLAECACSLPCGTVASGVLTFSDISEEDNAPATGTATWGRLMDGSGTWIADFDVGGGSSSAFLKLNSTSLYQGGIVRITSSTISI